MGTQSRDGGYAKQTVVAARVGDMHICRRGIPLHLDSCCSFCHPSILSLILPPHTLLSTLSPLFLRTLTLTSTAPTTPYPHAHPLSPLPFNLSPTFFLAVCSSLRTCSFPAMSSSPSVHSLDVESGAVPSTSPKPTTRRTVIISAIVVLLVLVAVIATVASTVRPSSSSSSSSPPTPTPTSATRTLDRIDHPSPWQLDTSRRPPLGSLMSSDLSASLAASRADSSDPHSFLLSFPARNQQWLESELEAVSSPTSARYGQYLTFEALMGQVGPTAASKAAVLDWLQASGVELAGIADHGDLLHVLATVGQVESLFGTTMHYHTNTYTGQRATVSKGEVTVPAQLPINAAHGVYTFPHQVMHVGTHLATARPKPSVPSEQHNMQTMQHSFHTMETNRKCSGSFGYYPLVSPQFLATQYNYTLRNTSTGLSNTSLCVTAFGAQAFNQTDLTHQQGNIGFSQSFANPAVFSSSGNTFNLQHYGTGVEANLDIQVIYQLSPTSNNSFYSSSAGGLNSLLQTLTAIAALPVKQRPQVVSISYTFDASDYQYYGYSGDGPNTETKLQQLAALGVTVVASSGDDGTSGPYNRQCSTAPNSLGEGVLSPSNMATTTFLPGYPASSAYVLSVGETDFLGSTTSSGQAYGAFNPSVNLPAECDNCPADQSYGYLCQATNYGEEVVSMGAKNDITGQTSGGGFSSVFTAPSWQKANVSSYLKTKCAASAGCTLPPSSYYNGSNRGFPDVAVFGGQFGVTVNGREMVLAGTSVAAPIWAGIIARLNEIQLARKGATLGLVAPLLYAMATAQPNTFHDITTGENTCPQGNVTCQAFVQGRGGSTTCKGWRGATGWDPVTGLGSPNVGNIITYLQTH